MQDTQVILQKRCVCSTGNEYLLRQVLLRYEQSEESCNMHYVARDLPTDIRGEKEPELGARDLLLLGIKNDRPLDFFRKMRGLGRLVTDYCPDYWISKAIAAGSYHALLWMERDLGLSLDHYQFPHGDGRGRGLLHCLADSPQAFRFFATWAGKSHRYHRNNKEAGEALMACLTLSSKGEASTAMNIRDKDGNSFLHALVLNGNNHSLHCILETSRSNQCLWELVKIVNDKLEPIPLWTDNQGRTAASVARTQQQYRVAKLMDDFASLCCVHLLSQVLAGGEGTAEKITRIHKYYAKVKDTTCGSSKKSGMLADMKDMHQCYGSDHFISLGDACLTAAEAGNLPVLKWLYDNRPKDESRDAKQFFNQYSWEVDTTADRGEFTCRHTVTAAKKLAPDES